MEIPAAFLKRMKKQLGDDYPLFERSLSEKAPTALRINPKKPTNNFGSHQAVPWCTNAFYLDKRPDFVFDPHIHAGAYYVQDASSMLFSLALNYDKPLQVLDLCAAPGGKSTLLLSLLHENSLVFSNEIVSKRAQILRENLVKWGHANVIVTNNRVSDFHFLDSFFDVLLIDAPCSGESMFRKNQAAIREWSETKSFKCSVEQRNILDEALPLLKAGGLLIYVTCTYSPEENEQILEWLCKKYEDVFEPIQIKTEAAWGIEESLMKHQDQTQSYMYKAYPHKTRGEGIFFAAFKIRKSVAGREAKLLKKGLFQAVSNKSKEEICSYLKDYQDYAILQKQDEVFAIPLRHLPAVLSATEHLDVLKCGVMLGQINKKNGAFIPSHELAMSFLINNHVARVEVNKKVALQYLRNETLSIEEIQIEENQWTLISYEGLILGWIKKISKRINNFYPKNWKIRKSEM
jgi:16S rRNA C967 or C1407 C5-methylase (RsmB/RsmF family)/NOL1/NOP2/fmu family ribosome biogenesis protein